jgi:uroporphyrin-III C-methyltransferase/precorrin-2 dehydrogenase/sirohydrochlorin ferrochelatase
MGFMSSQRNRTTGTQAARIGRLAKLPVFWGLAGKPVLIAGGSDGAAWKAELIAACGAEVHVFCRTEDMGEAMSALLCAAEADGGHFVHHDCHWREAHLKSFAMAIADCEDEAEANSFFEAACMAGVPVNVIDKPAFCQFQFGSIVNRSPVIIGISTDGAAPILAQAIRRKVEAVLPLALKGWAALAQSIRAPVNERLLPGAPRRLFWERFTERALTGEAAPLSAAALLAEADDLADTTGAPRIMQFIPVADPDPELLTLKAIRHLQAADLILHDEAVPAAILEFARREATRVPLASAARDFAGQLPSANGRVVRLLAGQDLAGRLAVECRQAHRTGFAVEVLPAPALIAASAARPRLIRFRAVGRDASVS